MSHYQDHPPTPKNPYGPVLIWWPPSAGGYNGPPEDEPGPYRVDVWPAPTEG